MRTGLICSLVALVGFLGTSTANAQDAGKAGITMGFPGSIGVIWHASDRVAIRPEITFSGASADADGPGEVKGDNWALATGLGVLFYLSSQDNLRTYFTPRIAYTRTSATTEISSVTTSSSKNTSNSLGGFGSFGAQYNLGDKFGVFGELGFGVTRATARGSSTFSSGESRSTQWGTRAGVGVIYYP